MRTSVTKRIGRTAGVLLCCVLCSVVVRSREAAATLHGPGTGRSAHPAAGADLTFDLSWTDSYAKDAEPFAYSSPVSAELPGGPAVVAGDREGNVYAVYLKNGAKAWTVTTRGPDGPVGVDSSPSSLDGTVYFGIGWAGVKGAGGYDAIDPSGARKWFQYAVNPTTDPTPDAGVVAGLTIGSLQSETAIVGPSMGENLYVFNASSGARLEGYPWYQADTNFSTAAVADVEGNGRDQIIVGGNTSAGVSYGTTYVNGGQLRILGEDGNGGDTSHPNTGLYCEYQTDQGIDSSPAVGDVLDGEPGIVVGTSTERADVSTTDDVLMFDNKCHLVWKATLAGATRSSPALADVLGNGDLQVIEGTENTTTKTGWVYCLNSLNGSDHWKTEVPGEVIGSVVTTDLGTGYEDVLVPTTSGLYVLDGNTGRLVGTVEDTVGLQNSPLVTEDANGTIGITIAGYVGDPGGPHAVMEHFEVAGSDGSHVDEAGAWPEFHHDPQLTGDANVPAADNLAVTTSSLPAATEDKPYSATVQAASGATPYTWSRISGSKPPGTIFSTSGTWSGTPTGTGTFTFVAEVTDATGTRATRTLSITVDKS